MGDTAKPVVIDEHTKKILAVKALMRERDIARVESDFGKSDTLRDKLMSEYGVTIFDQNGGPSGWKFQDGSTKKLPAGIIEAKLPGAVKLEKRKREEGSEDKAGKTAKVVKKEKEVVKPKAKAALKPAVVQENNRNSALVNSILGAGTSDTVKVVQGVKIEEKKVGSGKVATSGKRIKVGFIYLRSMQLLYVCQRVFRLYLKSYHCIYHFNYSDHIRFTMWASYPMEIPSTPAPRNPFRSVWALAK